MSDNKPEGKKGGKPATPKEGAHKPPHPARPQSGRGKKLQLRPKQQGDGPGGDGNPGAEGGATRGRGANRGPRRGRGAHRGQGHGQGQPRGGSSQDGSPHSQGHAEGQQAPPSLLKGLPKGPPRGHPRGPPRGSARGQHGSQPVRPLLQGPPRGGVPQHRGPCRQGPPRGPNQGPPRGPPRGPNQGPPRGPPRGPPPGPNQGPRHGPPKFQRPPPGAPQFHAPPPMFLRAGMPNVNVPPPGYRPLGLLPTPETMQRPPPTLPHKPPVRQLMDLNLRDAPQSQTTPKKAKKTPKKSETVLEMGERIARELTEKHAKKAAPKIEERSMDDMVQNICSMMETVTKQAERAEKRAKKKAKKKAAKEAEKDTEGNTDDSKIKAEKAEKRAKKKAEKKAKKEAESKTEQTEEEKEESKEEKESKGARRRQKQKANKPPKEAPEPTPTPVKIDPKEILKLMISLHNGRCNINQLDEKITSKFTDIDLVQWFAETPMFTVFSNDITLTPEIVSVFVPGARLCFNYKSPTNPCTGTGKDGKPCRYLHLCRNHVRNKCPGATITTSIPGIEQADDDSQTPKPRKCTTAHNMTTKHNAAIKRRLGLGLLSKEDALTVVRCSAPMVCEAYNGAGVGMESGAAGVVVGQCADAILGRCLSFHICNKSILGRCNADDPDPILPCTLRHDISHEQRRLEEFRIDKLPPKIRLRLLLPLASTDDPDPDPNPDPDDQTETASVLSRTESALSLSGSSEGSINLSSASSSSSDASDSSDQEEEDVIGYEEEGLKVWIDGVPEDEFEDDDEDEEAPYTSYHQYGLQFDEVAQEVTEEHYGEYYQEEREEDEEYHQEETEEDEYYYQEPQDPKQEETSIITDRIPEPPLEESESQEYLAEQNYDDYYGADYDWSDLETKESTVICEEYIERGECEKGEECPNLHCPYAPVWQVELSDGIWQCVTEEEQGSMEEAYRDINASHTWLLPLPGYYPSLQVDLDTLTARHGGGEMRVRRLSTPSYILSPGADLPDAACCYWLWCFCKGDQWIAYGQDQNAPYQDVLEAKFAAGETTAIFSRSGVRYEVDMGKMVERNLQTGEEVSVRRRPADKDNISSRKMYQKEKLPLDWLPMDTETPNHCERITLKENSADYQSVKMRFQQTMPASKFTLLSISRVQNLSLWNRYQEKIKEFADKRGSTPTIKSLFHGTNSAETVDCICYQNFDPRMHGKNATKYGKGSYFATTAQYSNHYTDHTPTHAPNFASEKSPPQTMFLASVLVGAVTVGNETMQRPPPLSPDTPWLLYDATVDRLPNPTIYVLYDAAQCYPQFLIEYRNVEEEGGAKKSGARSVIKRAPVAAGKGHGQGRGQEVKGQGQQKVPEPPKSPEPPTTAASPLKGILKQKK